MGRRKKNEETRFGAKAVKSEPESLQYLTAEERATMDEKAAKNLAAARQFRARQKGYIDALETKRDELAAFRARQEQENARLARQNAELRARVDLVRRLVEQIGPHLQKQSLTSSSVVSTQRRPSTAGSGHSTSTTRRTTASEAVRQPPLSPSLAKELDVEFGMAVQQLEELDLSSVALNAMEQSLSSSGSDAGDQTYMMELDSMFESDEQDGALVTATATTTTTTASSTSSGGTRARAMRTTCADAERRVTRASTSATNQTNATSAVH